MGQGRPSVSHPALARVRDNSGRQIEGERERASWEAKLCPFSGNDDVQKIPKSGSGTDFGAVLLLVRGRMIGRSIGG